MHPQSPRYSFIVPVRDRLDFLPLCLERIAAQTETDYEIIVAAHGGYCAPPCLPETVRVVWWETEAPWNQAVAVNIGIANAVGQRLVIVNADIIMSSTLLSTVDLLLTQNAHQHIYWRRFDLTKKGLQYARDENVDWNNLFVCDCSEQWQENGWGKWHALTAYGDFLAVARDPVLVLGGFDEQMPGWGGYDIDMARRLTDIGCHEYWGASWGLVHQYHVPQATQRQSGDHNARRYRWDLRTVRNGGASHFDKYRIEQ